ncbi:diaminopimelate epimerase [Alsobacter sp. SYSU M60028]|uniref:Diaminopimelate epimerase n=1 Tax=Alsobacter ponti TaxID=2962936 RepID=A0ABT1LG81_9HYPH|nr:diaminopimelate epimerase [Alsobacter ponti]MCP8940514.1 diaminopimelate epimerase [Alsobacter ponti]
MSALVGHRYAKMNGIGNEIVVLDLRATQAVVTPAEARAIARAPGLAFDQLMVLHAPTTTGVDAYMRIYNNDGSESGACGNGTRCVAWMLLQGSRERAVTLATKAGLLPTTRDGDVTFTVDMGPPRLRWDEIPLSEPFADTTGVELQVGPIDAPLLHTPSVVNMGNPHAIFWVDDVKAYDLSRIGPLLEHHPLFPERANISLAHIVSPEAVTLRTWERGAGLTRACGSAACATAVAAARLGKTGRRVRVAQAGGELVISWRESDGHVLMTGPVELEHEGVLPASVFAGAA